MDKVKKYKKLVRELAEEVANLGQIPDNKIETQRTTSTAII